MRSSHLSYLAAYVAAGVVATAACSVNVDYLSAGIPQGDTAGDTQAIAGTAGETVGEGGGGAGAGTGGKAGAGSKGGASGSGGAAGRGGSHSGGSSSGGTGGTKGMGGTKGSGGSSGAVGSGGVKASGGSAGSTAMGGSSSGGAGSGGTSSSACVPNASLRELFDFSDGNASLASDAQLHIGLWALGPYGSTDLKTGSPDNAAYPNPPNNPTNLANVSTLMSEASAGNPLPAMKVTAAFTGKFSYAYETLHVVYAYAAYHPDAPQGAVVNLTGRTLTADVKLVSTPHSDCSILARAWATAGSGFNRIDSALVGLPVGEWGHLALDLDLANTATVINQIGVTLYSNCQSAGAGGSGNTTDGAVILVDNVSVACK